MIVHTRLRYKARVGRRMLVVNGYEGLVGGPGRGYASGGYLWYGRFSATAPRESDSERGFAQRTPFCIRMDDCGLAHHDQGAVFVDIALLEALSPFASTTKKNQAEDQQCDKSDDG